VLIKSQKDFFAGLMFAVIGVSFAIGAWDYSLGTAARMGPGYFPFMLGLILCGIGIIISVLSFRSTAPDGDKIGKWAFKPLVLILGANLVFGALLVGVPALGIPQFGLIVGIYGLVIVASFAGDSFKPKEVLILATILAIGSYLAFVKLLNLQFPVWPAFLTQ